MKLPKRKTVDRLLAKSFLIGLPAAPRVHQHACNCKKCTAVREAVAAVEKQLYTLAQLGRVGVISPQELTGGEKVMHAGGKA